EDTYFCIYTISYELLVSEEKKTHVPEDCTLFYNGTILDIPETTNSDVENCTCKCDGGP
ncbi:hypothetical protein MTO96_035575, partial [Rhipicephalus appendiculatus]